MIDPPDTLSTPPPPPLPPPLSQELLEQLDDDQLRALGFDGLAHALAIMVTAYRKQAELAEIAIALSTLEVERQKTLGRLVEKIKVMLNQDLQGMRIVI